VSEPNVAAWLRERTPAPPERLATAIEAALAEHLDAPRTEVADRCIDAAEALLRDLLARPSAGRDSALDLLTVDALVTYAFEAAAEDPSTLDERARDAARRLAAVTNE
jgi:hypothetical protein